MYCPECGVDYRLGFTKCSDCLVALIPQRPRRTRDRVTILEGNDPRLFASARDLLEESGIPCHIWQEEGCGGGVPVVQSLYRPSGLEVPLDVEVEARALLQSIETSDFGGDLQEQQGPPPDPNLEIVTVLEANDPLLIASAKGVLKKAGIPFYVYGEEYGLRYAPLEGFQPWCRIQVAVDRQAQARELVQPFECAEANEAEPEEGHEPDL
jgi:hypothetical protein